VSDAPDGSTDPGGLEAHERARRRTTRNVALAGPVLGVLGAGAIAAIGGSGAAGLAVLLLLSAVGLAAAGIVTLWLALVDEHRGRPAPRRRILVGLGLLVATPVVVTMSLGAAGG
jgi:hypothetical protein